MTYYVPYSEMRNERKGTMFLLWLATGIFFVLCLLTGGSTFWIMAFLMFGAYSLYYTVIVVIKNHFKMGAHVRDDQLDELNETLRYYRRR